MQRQIIIKVIRRDPGMDGINWLCRSFDLCAGRDTEQIAQKIIRCLLTRKGSATSEEIAADLNIAQQRVNYHIRSLMETGLIYRQEGKILLRENTIRSAIAEMRRDAEHMFERMLEAADEIDKEMGLR